MMKRKGIKMQLTIEIKTNYGKEAIYPVCEKAKTFAKLIGSKTLTRESIETIKTLGYSFTVQQVQL